MAFKEPDHTTTGVGIYSIESGVTGNFYVGSSIAVQRRLAVHASQLKRGQHPNKNLQAEYDLGHPLSVNTQSCRDRKDAYAQEQILLDLSHGSPYCLNISPKAVGITHTEETRRKIGLASRGRKHTQQMKDRLRARLVGRLLTEEHKAKIGASSRGRSRSVEFCEKVSQGLMGHECSEETRRKISETKSLSPIIIDGVLYRNLVHASQLLGMPPGTINSRLHSNSYPLWRRILPSESKIIGPTHLVSIPPP